MSPSGDEMIEPTCAQVQEMMGAFSVGALDEEERVRVEAHLTGCEECRGLATAYGEIVSLLPLGLQSAGRAVLPPELKARVLNAVTEDGRPRLLPVQRRAPSLPAGVKGWPRFQTVAAAVAVILLALSLAWGLRQTDALAKERSLRSELAELVGQQQAIFDVVDSSRTSKAFLRATGPNSTAYGKLYSRPDLSTVVVFVAQMPKLEAGMVDHLWLSSSGQTRLAGTLTLNDRGFGALVFDAGQVGPSYENAQVVMEPEDSTQPSGNVIVRWEAPR